jgi:hypothetical protein
MTPRATWAMLYGLAAEAAVATSDDPTEVHPQILQRDCVDLLTRHEVLPALRLACA